LSRQADLHNFGDLWSGNVRSVDSRTWVVR